MKIRHLVMCCAAMASLATGVHAKEQILDAVPFEGKKVRLDGMLKEWPQLVTLGERLSGRGGGDPAAKGLVAYDNDNVYVAMRVTDATLKRTSAFSDDEDHASLKLAFPRRGGGFKTYQVKLFPGDPGKSAGAVKLPGLGKVPGAKIIEMPIDGGISFEASIPWSVFPEAKSTRSGMRGALLYHDADGRSVESVIGTSTHSGSDLPMLTIEGEYALNNSLVFPKALSTKPNREVFANLTGSSMLERIAVYERYLTVSGWAYRGGTQFFYQDLNLMNPGDLKQISAADFDKDGHDELFIVRRVGTSGKARIYAEVWKFSSDTAAPQPIFQHEVGMTEDDANIVNKVEVSRKRGKVAIIVAQGSYNHVDPENWNALVAGDGVEPTLMPWEPVAYRRYEWNGDKFEMVDEKSGKAKLKKPNKGTRLYSASGPPARAGSGASAADPMAGSDQAPPPAPRPPSAEELQDRVYALYRSDRGMKRGKPRFDFVTNVAGDETPERVLIHGTDLVVFGKNFKEGNSYVYTTIGVKEPGDVLDVTARDVTGDGTAEVIVRGVIHAQASKAMGGKVVTRHALFIYKVQQHAISRIFAAETGRSLGDDMVLGNVRFTPVGRALWIDLLPGRAVGWTEKTYPFPEDQTPYGGLEPLILPWSGTPPRRYSYQGTEFKPR